MSELAGVHVFIPGLFKPLPAWQRDFAFEPESAVLMTLLADAQRLVVPVDGLERSLLHWLGADVNNHLPWATLRHRFESGGMYQPPLMCADPVCMQAAADTLNLGAEAPALTAAETEELLIALNHHLQQDGLVLKAFHPQRWYLHALDGAEDVQRPDLPATTPLSEVGTGNVFPYLPRSPAKTNYWWQLLNELQMLLHTQPVNQRREAAGQSAVNGVWFWGEGSLQAADTEAGLRSVNAVQGGGFTGQIFAQAAGARYVSNAEITEVEAGAATVVILDALQQPMLREQPAAWQRALAELDDYLSDLLAWQRAGQGQVTMYDTNGQGWRCQKPSGWKFWRKPQADWPLLTKNVREG